MKALAPVLLSVFLFSCALPRADDKEQSFVPERELDVVSLVRQGLNYYQRSRFTDAEFAFRKALYLYPKAANVKLNLAAALQGSGQFEEAEDILIALQAGAPESLEYLAALGRLYVDTQDYLKARRYFMQAFELALKNGDLTSGTRFAGNIAAIAFRTGDEEASLCHAQQAYMLVPDATQLLQYSKILLGLNHVEQARTLLNTYLAQPQATRSSALLVQTALAELALGNHQRVLELASSIESSTDLTGDIQLQASEVLSLAKAQTEPSTSIDGSELEPDDEEQPEDKGAEMALERSSLYWPAQALELRETKLRALTSTLSR